MKLRPLCIALIFPLLAHAEWRRIGSIPARPVNLATVAIEGVGIASSEGIEQPENLLSGNAALASAAPVGESNVVVRLHRQTDVNLVAFSNDGLQGAAEIQVSADAKNWAVVASCIMTKADQEVRSKFASAQGRYLKLQLRLTLAGSLRGLQIYGTETDRDFELQPPPPKSKASVNMGGGLGGCRIIYMHPESAESHRDAALYGRMAFPESAEKYRTVIYDLGQERTLTEIGSVNSARPVRLTTYAFRTNELEEQEDWRGWPSFDPKTLDSREPLAIEEDRTGLGWIKSVLKHPVRARYLAMRWEPDFNPPAFTVSGVSIVVSGVIKVKAAGAQQPDPRALTAGVGAAEAGVANPFSLTTGGFGKVPANAQVKPVSTAGSDASGLFNPPPPPASSARPTPRPRSP